MVRTPEDSQVMRGLLDTLVLYLLREGDNYGYGLLREANRWHAKPPVLHETTVYPLLRRLEKRGLLTSYRRPGARGTARKYYGLTRHGRAYLAARVDDWRRASLILDDILRMR